MKTLKIDVPGYGTWHVHHHGDWSGEVIINGPPTKPGDWKGESVEIPAAVFLAIGHDSAFERIRSGVISALEDMDHGSVRIPELQTAEDFVARAKLEEVEAALAKMTECAKAWEKAHAENAARLHELTKDKPE